MSVALCERRRSLSAVIRFLGSWNMEQIKGDGSHIDFETDFQFGCRQATPLSPILHPSRTARLRWAPSHFPEPIRLWRCVL